MPIQESSPESNVNVHDKAVLECGIFRADTRRPTDKERILALGRSVQAPNVLTTLQNVLVPRIDLAILGRRLWWGLKKFWADWERFVFDRHQ